MRRFYPLIMMAAFVLLIVGGLIWKMASAKECMDGGGTVVGAMTRNQDCAADR